MNPYKTRHWRQLRKRLIDNNSDCRCQLCNKKKWGARGGSKFKAHLHHLTYEREGQERDTDVIVLCPSCHSLLHEIKHRKSTSPFITELQKVVDEAESLIRQGVYSDE